MKLAVVVPTYNENENIPSLVTALFNQAKNFPDHTLEVVIADSFSPDGTGDLVRELRKSNPHLHLVEDKRRGIGIGLLTGLEYAFDKLKAQGTICMDADFSHDPSVIPQFVEEFEKGTPIVIGSRYIEGGGTKNWGVIRKVGSFLVNHYIRIMLGLSPNEITTNFRLFSKKVWEKLDKPKVPWTERSFLTTPTLLYYALQAEPRFIEIPIIFADRTKGYSKAALLNYTWAVFKFSLKERKETLKTFLKFLGIGFTGVVVNLFVIYFLVEKLGVVKELASPIAVESSILSNFVLNNFWTFRTRKVEHGIISRMIKYNILSLAGLGINFLVFITLANVFRINYLLAQFVGIAIATPWTFLTSMKWAWRKS